MCVVVCFLPSEDENCNFVCGKVVKDALLIRRGKKYCKMLNKYVINCHIFAFQCDKKCEAMTISTPKRMENIQFCYDMNSNFVLSGEEYSSFTFGRSKQLLSSFVF